jgi:hypothetical protein
MYIKLMADYASDGVWDENGAMLDRDELPITGELLRDITDWCNRYESSQFYYSTEERTRDFDTRAHNAQGEILARRLQEELPDWTVKFQGEMEP